MKKQFTTAFVMAAAITAAHAQVLKYDGEAVNLAKGEKVDSVNWYGGWSENGGSITTGVEDADASNGLAMKIVNPEEQPDEDGNKISGTGTGNDWERVLKFDGLQIKPGTIYRVRLTAKAPYDAPVQVAMMRGDENCDMPWVVENENGTKSEFRTDLSGWDEGDYTTKTAMFYYTSNELQEKFYGEYNKTEAMPDNQFLRLSFKGVGTYMMDGVVVEEASIAGITFNDQAIKVDFGFPTNAAALAKADERGCVLLDPAMFTVIIDDETVTPLSVELKQDGGLYIFVNPDDYLMGEDSKVVVSFNNADCGLTYSGALTPGNGKAVASFEAEVGTYNENIDAMSFLYEPAMCISSSPADGSFELDGTLNQFTFTFNKNIFVKGESAPTAVLSSSSLKKDEQLEIVGAQDDLSTSVTFQRPAGRGDLPNGSYTIVVKNVNNEMGINSDEDYNIVTRIDFEVGKVQVAETVVTPYATVWMAQDCEANAIPAGWTCLKEYIPEGEEEPIVEEWQGGSSCRAFKFSPDGVSATGFYICDRDNAKFTLRYGDQDSYMIHLPAGNIDFGVTAVGWQGQHPKVEYSVVNFNTNEVVATGSAALEKTVGAAGEVISEYDRISTKFKLDEEGDYMLIVHNTADISQGAQILGFDIKTYTQTAGATADSEIIISEDFSDVPNGNVPEAGRGWTIYDSGNPAKKGEAQSGRNRIMSINATGLTIGFYNRCFGDPAAYNMTYGEMTAEEPEPALELDAVKYNFSWMACNWKGDSQTYYFQILDEDGNVVYSREDVVTANVEGNSKDAEAVKIEFSFTPAEPGRYMLNWYMTGESVIGKIKIEKMGSLAVYYRNLLLDAVQEAKEERENCNSEEFAGTTRNNLDAAIAAATNPDFHTGKEYTDAIETLKGYVKAMITRRQAIAEYNSMIVAVEGLLEELGDTKYAALEAYKELEALYDQYKEVYPSTLEDEELLPVQNKLTVGYNYCKNMKESVISLYTHQIDMLVSQLAQYDEEETFLDHPVVLAAGNALTDDQELAADLQKMLTAAIYERCAKDENPFLSVDVDPDTEEEYEEEIRIDATGYIQNADVYCTSTQKENIPAETAMKVFPGWTIQGTINVAWGWDGWSVSETNPAANGRFATGWGGSNTVSQQLGNLPVGVYVYAVETGDGSHIGQYDAETGSFTDGFENKSTIFYTIGEETTETPFNLANSNPWRGMAVCETEEFTLPAGEHNLASMTVGASMVADGDFANVDNFRLYLIGKAEGFDYAAAAAALKQEIADAIIAPEETQHNGTPVSVVYYNTAGMKTTNPKGVTIRVERWADGYMRVSKLMK